LAISYFLQTFKQQA